MEPRSVLLVADDLATRERLASLFREHGYRVEEAPQTDLALARLEEAELDVVLTDIRMPGKSAIEMVGDVRRLRPETPVILLTEFGSMASAVEAMRAGAFDYVTKPFEPEAVLFAVERAVERRALGREKRSQSDERCAEALVAEGAARTLSLAEVEDLYIDEILRRTGGNKVRAAHLLGIDRKTLYRRAERKLRASAKE
jgi:two-component system, NtrC family, response regulator AtoC